jgi:hypothetical protein
VAGKRSYTVPILLIIITGMSIMLVMLYSKLLLAQQYQTTEDGQRLAERYNIAVRFAASLSEGTNLLLRDASAADRMRAKAMLGQTSFASGETVGILTEASFRSTGQTREQALLPISMAMSKILHEGKADNLQHVAEHDGPLSPEEKALLTTVSEGAAEFEQAIGRFRPPTVTAGYRNMAAGQGWVEPAAAAAKALEKMAAKLK